MEDKKKLKQVEETSASGGNPSKPGESGNSVPPLGPIKRAQPAAAAKKKKTSVPPLGPIK